MGAGDEKGNLYVFDPMHAVKTAAMNKDGTRGPTSQLSFHKDSILSICFAPGPDPTAPRPRVVSVSACHRIGIWDVRCDKTWGAVQLVGRLRPKDFVPTSVCALVSGVYQPGTTGVLISTNTAAVRPANTLWGLACCCVPWWTVGGMGEQQARQAARVHASAGSNMRQHHAPRDAARWLWPAACRGGLQAHGGLPRRVHPDLFDAMHQTMHALLFALG